MCYAADAMRLLLATVLVGAAAAPARAEVEVGVTGGAHGFSVNNELGVRDVPDADSPRNGPWFGVRVGVRISDVLGIEAEVGATPTETRTSPGIDVRVGFYRAHLVAELAGARPRAVVPFVLLGGGAAHILSTGADRSLDRDLDGQVHVGAGVKRRLEAGWGVRLDVRALFPPSSKDEFAALDGELLVSAYRTFGRRAAAAAPPPEVGAVGPTADADGDAVPDDVDACPHEPEDRDGWEDDDGCPDLDDDGDGVRDHLDACPRAAEDLDGWQDDDGCPDLDDDGDGIVDLDDACPREAEDVDGWQDDDGCPDLDNDGDGVADAVDACPDHAEVVNGFDDGDGCPDEIPAELSRLEGPVAVEFQRGRDRITRKGTGVLTAVAEVLARYPAIGVELVVRDPRADLAGRRAAAVRAFLIGQGVAEDRLIVTGTAGTPARTELRLSTPSP
jgi:hypothetical protein